MTYREKILAAAVLGLLLLWGAGTLWSNYNSALDARHSELLAVQDRIGQAQLALNEGRRAVENLEGWQLRSLPANRELAQSIYRTWLEKCFKEAGLSVDDIQPTQRIVPTEAYTAIGYTVTARGNLKALTSLLHEYYRSTMLQQITRLTLRPDTNPARLNITLQTEALILPGTPQEELPTGVSDRLAHATAEQYGQSIGERNLFTVYTPPRPASVATARREAPAPPKFDDAKHAYVTGIVQIDGRLQAWITVRTTGEVLRLFAGDAVKIGLIDGKIVSIAPRLIVLEYDDQHHQIELGHNLRDGKTEPKTEEG